MAPKKRAGREQVMALATASKEVMKNRAQNTMRHRGPLSDLPLPGGVTLKDATREQVLEAVDFYERDSRDADRRHKKATAMLTMLRAWIESNAASA
jgi:hypothetical protein